MFHPSGVEVLVEEGRLGGAETLVRVAVQVVAEEIHDLGVFPMRPRCKTLPLCLEEFREHGVDRGLGDSGKSLCPPGHGEPLLLGRGSPLLGRGLPLRRKSGESDQEWGAVARRARRGIARPGRGGSLQGALEHRVVPAQASYVAPVGEN